MKLVSKIMAVLIVIALLSGGLIFMLSSSAMEGFVNTTKDTLIGREKAHLTQLANEYGREVEEKLESIASLVNSTAEFIEEVYEKNLFVNEINGTLNQYYYGFFSGVVNGNVSSGFRGYYGGKINGTVGGGIIKVVGVDVNWTYLKGEFNGSLKGVLWIPTYLWMNGTYNGNKVSWHNETIEVNGVFSGSLNAALNGQINGNIQNGWIDGALNGYINGTLRICDIMGDVKGYFKGTINTMPNYMEKLFSAIVSKGSKLIQWFYMGTPQREFFTNKNLQFALATLGAVGYDCRIRNWYKMAENEKTLIWTPIYVDAGGAGLMFTVAKPVYSSKGELLAVVSADVTIASIIDYISTIKVGKSGYTMLIAHDGSLIAFPGLEKLQYNATEWLENVATENLKNTNNRDLSLVVEDMIAGKSGCGKITVKENDTLKYSPARGIGIKYIAYAPIMIAGWSIGIVIDEKEIIKPATDMQTTMENEIGKYYVLTAVILVIVVVVSIGIGNYIGRPVKHLTSVAEKISKGNMEMEIDKKWLSRKDEIGELAKAFERMVNSFKVMMKELESEHGDTNEREDQNN